MLDTEDRDRVDKEKLKQAILDLLEHRQRGREFWGVARKRGRELFSNQMCLPRHLAVLEG